MAESQKYTGTVTVNGQTFVNGVEVNVSDAYDVEQLEQAFGETAAPQNLGNRKVSGSMRWRYDDGAGWTALRALYTAQTEFDIVCTPVTGAGKNTFTVTCKLSSMPLNFPAGKTIMCTADFVSTDDAGVTDAPALVLTPAAGALTGGTVSVAYTATTFACTGGSAAYTYSLEGDNEIFPGSSLNTSTGAVTGTPPAGTAGTYRSKVRATDANGVYIVQEYTIVIAP